MRSNKAWRGFPITRIKALSLLLSGAALTAGLIWLYVNDPESLSRKRAMDQESQPAPEAVFSTLQGEPFTLSSLKGKTLLLNFWASWCPPCVAEFPGMVELVHRSKGKLVLVAVSQDNSPDDIRRFLARMPEKTQALLKENAQVKVLFDKRGQVAASQFAVLRLPETFVITPDHRIARKFVGEVNWLAPEVEKYFDSLSP